MIRFRIAKCGKEEFSLKGLDSHFQFDMYSYWEPFGYNILELQHIWGLV